MGRLFASRGAFRRLVTPVLLAGAAWSGAAALNGVYVPLVVLGVVAPLPDDVYVPLAWSLNVVRIAVLIAIYVGIVRLRRERSAVADVIVEIAEAPDPTGLQAALRGALDDPSLRVLPWDAEAGAYVDPLGKPFDATGPTEPGRAVTVLAHEGAPLAAVVHDAALVEEPGLLAAVVRRSADRAARAPRARGRREPEDVRASGARIVEAGDLERGGSSATCMTARSSDSSPWPCGPVGPPRVRQIRRRGGPPVDRGGGHRDPRGHSRAGRRHPSGVPHRGRPGGCHPDSGRPFADPGRSPVEIPSPLRPRPGDGVLRGR